MICNEDSYKVEEIVKRIYMMEGIQLEKVDNKYIDVDNKVRIEIMNNYRGVNTNINGIANKLNKLGWKCKYKLDDILLKLK